MRADRFSAPGVSASRRQTSRALAAHVAGISRHSMTRAQHDTLTISLGGLLPPIVLPAAIGTFVGPEQACSPNRLHLARAAACSQRRAFRSHEEHLCAQGTLRHRPGCSTQPGPARYPLRHETAQAPEAGRPPAQRHSGLRGRECRCDVHPAEEVSELRGEGSNSASAAVVVGGSVGAPSPPASLGPPAVACAWGSPGGTEMPNWNPAGHGAAMAYCQGPSLSPQQRSPPPSAASTALLPQPPPPDRAAPACPARRVCFGQSVVLTGDAEELGGWDLGRAPRMEWSEGHNGEHHWTATVSLPAGATLEYKFVIEDKNQ